MVFLYLVIFILGAIIGSFLNVVILRLGTGKGLRGRSICFSCRKKLEWYELIPILSFFIQKGHCRNCYSRISYQYPIVEMLTGLVFLLTFLQISNFQFPISNFLIYLPRLIYLIYYFVIFSILIVISVYDIRHKIIPNKLVWIFIILSLISGFLVNCQLLNVNCFIGNWKLEIGNLGSHILSGVVLSLPLALIWLLSKGKLMGLGDAKLALGIGFLLGLSQGVAALVLSFWIGAIFGIILIIFSRFIRAAPVRSLWRRRAYLRSYPRFSASMKSEIPFGPFLIISTFIIFLFDLDVISLLSLFVT